MYTLETTSLDLKEANFRVQAALEATFSQRTSAEIISITSFGPSPQDTGK